MPSSGRVAATVVVALLVAFAGNAVQMTRTGEIGLFAASVALVSMSALMAAMPFVSAWYLQSRKDVSMGKGEKINVDVKVGFADFNAMCINAERYAIGRANHVSRDCAEFLLKHAGDMSEATKYVIARDIKCERQTCERCAGLSGRKSEWHGDFADAWDRLYDALGQDVVEDYL